MLTLKDVTAGNTYYAEYSTDLGDYAIINCDKDCNLTTSLGGIQIIKKKYWKSNWWSCKNNIRLATDEEKAWLQHCIKEDKFVEYEEFMKVYKPQFIVGQWYKTKKYYVKCIKHINGKMTCSNLIRNDEFLDFKNSYYTFESDIPSGYKWELLTDLNEIQKFLPQDHPDKQLDIKQIQEECKKRFPIGCKFRCASTDNKNTLKQTNSTYNILGTDAIDAGILQGFLYYEGKYAELIETPGEIIVEYVECIIEDSCIEMGKIYQVDKNLGFKYANDTKPVYYLVENYRTPYYQSHFRPSTKSAYDLQNFKQQPLIPEQCYNTEIEVGDEVKVVYPCSTSGNRKGYVGYVKRIFQGSLIDFGSCQVYEINGWCEHISALKLIKKANKNTTTTLNKKVDVSSPKVTDRLRLKVRNQTTVVNTEERIKLKLNHLKTIKIKQNGN